LTALLDVNVLIALIDQQHVTTQSAQSWFEEHHSEGWATCPITENGVLRIVGHPRYRNFPGSISYVADALRALIALPGHVFWPDDFSLVSTTPVPELITIPSSNNLTDTYLLALAVRRRGTLVTFDRRLVSAAVDGGAEALVVIEP
jgi:uncharacterized protein